MEQRNRVVEGMQEWLQREDNISRLFSPATLRTRYFQELKLDYLRDLQQQIRKNASKDERMTLRILKGETKQLERMLYPNTIVRLARSIYRTIRHPVDKSHRNAIGEKTGWMMKVVHKDTKKEKDHSQQVRSPRNAKPEMVVKKRTSQQDKGLKM